MARRKEPIIPDVLLGQLLSGADPKTAFDPGGLLDGLKKALAERALNAEMDHHLAGENGAGNARNGYGRKTVTTDSGKFDLAVPRDRQSSFDPQLIARYQRRFPGFDEKIISMYARGMRLPVSTRRDEGLCGSMFLGIVWNAVAPCAPEDADPSASEDAHGVGMPASSLSGVSIDAGGPWTLVTGVVCKAGDCGAQALVAGPSPSHASGFSALVGDGRDTGLCGEVILALESGADVTQFGGDLCGTDLPGTREGHDDPSLGKLCDGVFNAAGELGDLGNEAFEGRGEGAYEFALGIGFGLRGRAGGSRAQASEEIGDVAPAAILVLGEEGSHALAAEPVGRLGRWIAQEEGQRYGAGNVGEQAGGARPKAFEKGAQLVGEDEPGGDQIVAPAHQRPECLDGVGLRLERLQPVTVGTQDVGEDVGIAGIALGGDGAVARPTRLDDVGMDRRDDEPGLHQHVDEQTARPFDRDGHLVRQTVTAQARDEMVEAVAVMGDGELIEAFAGGVEDADGMVRPAPVEADENGHGCTSLPWSKVPCAGSSRGMLINRRSGQHLAGLPVAHLPVARLGLPAAAAQQVSCGPSRGKQPRLSPRRPGTNAHSASKLIQRRREVA